MERNGRWKIDLRWREPGSKRWIRHAERLPAGITKETATARCLAFMNAALSGQLNKEITVKPVMAAQQNGSSVVIHGSATWVMVTPELAAQWMSADVNVGNRRISAQLVASYASDMENNSWLPNPQPIIFDGSGILRDGQHRLAAVVKSRRSILMFVYRGGEAVRAQEVIDCGKKRGVADQLMMFDGVTSGHLVAAIARAMGKIFIRDVNVTMTLQCVRAWLETYSEAIGAVMGVPSAREKLRANVLAPLATAYYADPAAILDLTDQLITGESLTRGMPAYALREWMVSGRLGGGSGAGATARSEGSLRVLAAAHAHIEKRSIVQLKPSLAAREFFMSHAPSPPRR